MRGIEAKKVPDILDESRFISRIVIDKKTGCWNYTGGQCGKGYGRFDYYINGKRIHYFAHRIAWSIFKGKLNPLLVLDHECRNRKCQNPDHLREISRGKNVIENSINCTAINKAKVVCLNGHEFTEKNTRINKLGSRVCRLCCRDRTRIVRQKKGVKK